jgi:thiol:disulfide interchange protein DsbD
MLPLPRALIGALVVVCAATAAAQVHEGRTIVTARLIADTASVQPGRPFTAGVHLTVAPGWHVYWENPGDTALPIEVQWQLPPGATVSPLRWPAPERFEEQGGVTVFGYERETLLLATVTPPPSIPGGSLTLQAKAKASWLVCELLCLPGEALVALTLPVGDAVPSQDAATLRTFAAKVPKEGAEAGVRITAARTWKDGERWLVTAELETGGRRIVRFFPRTIEGFLIDHGRIAVRGNAVELSADPDEPHLVPRRLDGVVVTDRGSFDVAANLNEERPGAAPVALGEPPPDPPSEPLSGPPSASGSTPAGVEPTAPPAGGDWLERDFTTGAQSKTLSLAALVFFALVGGLLLNVMPCVLPVISLKVLSFVQQAGQERRRTRILGLAFAAGILVSFWVLAAAVVIIRATAEQIGWGFQFQSPGFVLVMSAVVLVFAMNLFGVFEIGGFAFAGPAAAAQGAGGAFTHGVLATILATPCTAPFLGTAIGFAFTQSAGVLFLAFTAAAFGLALPYVLLAWHPGWLRSLPRPGAWLIRFKQAMGFVLLATVIWLLSILGAQLGPEGVVWSLVFLMFVALAVWIVGQVRPVAGAVARVVWLGIAVVLVAGGYVWALERELRWREPVLATGEVDAGEGIAWQPFSLDDLQRRVERGETVFVDFTADWCWSCKVNERTVLASSRVRERLRELGVTPVKADWTNRNPEITRLLAKFGRAGVPFYAIFPAGRLSEPVALSEVITPASVVDALDRAGPSRTEVEK